MPARNTRRNRRGAQSRLRHNHRRRELIAARRVTLTQKSGPLIDLTLDSPPAPIDSTTSGTWWDDSSIVDLTVEDSPEPSISQDRSVPLPILPSSPYIASLSISYSAIPHASQQTPQPLVPRRLVYSSSPASSISSLVDSRATAPDLYRDYIDSPGGPPSPPYGRESPDSGHNTILFKTTFLREAQTQALYYFSFI